MTKIAYMAGVPQDEYKNRAAGVPARSFIPYLQMTKGEFKLALALENAKIDAGFYSDSPTAKKAVSMIENALYQGVSGGVNFIGSIPDSLQPVARLITQAGRENSPASKWGIVGRQTKGIAIGDPLIPVKYGNQECKKLIYEPFKKHYLKHRSSLPIYKRLPYLLPTGNIDIDTKFWKFFKSDKEVGEKYMEMLLACEYAQKIENILNSDLERASMQLLYHNMSSGFAPAVGTLALTKRLLHRAGVSDFANLAQVDSTLMSSWVELGQKRSAVLQGIAPEIAFSPVLSAMLAPDPDKWATQVLADIKKRGGAESIQAIVATLTAITAVITAISGALAIAAQMQKTFYANKVNALQNTQGFGTDAFQPEKNDYLKAKGDTPLTVPSDNSLLLLLGGGAALYFLSKK